MKETSGMTFIRVLIVDKRLKKKTCHQNRGQIELMLKSIGGGGFVFFFLILKYEKEILEKFIHF